MRWLKNIFRPRRSILYEVVLTDDGFEVREDGKIECSMKWNDITVATYYSDVPEGDTLGRIQIGGKTGHCDVYKEFAGWIEFAKEYERRHGPTDLRIE